MFALLSLLMSAHAEPTKFTPNSTETLDAGEWSIGLFAPLRYGITDKVELSVVHPGYVLQAPHLRVMIDQGSLGDWTVMTRHQVGYPTPMLRFFARGGIGGILPPDSVIPNTIVLKNDAYFGNSFEAGELTLSLGASIAVELGESDYSTIDYAFAFRQTNLYQNKLSVQIGVGWEQFFTDGIGVRTWNKSYFYPLADYQWVVESRDDLVFQVSEQSQALLGLNLSMAEYPWGTEWHAFPAADWVWVW
jgi:hypothetical protein